MSVSYFVFVSLRKSCKVFIILCLSVCVVVDKCFLLCFCQFASKLLSVSYFLFITLPGSCNMFLALVTGRVSSNNNNFIDFNYLTRE